jgi:hypothetical protein
LRYVIRNLEIKGLIRGSDVIDHSREVTAVGEIKASVFSGSCVECDPYGDLSLVV